MTVKLKNNASGTLATAVSASDTGVSLTTGNGANFPTLTAPDYFYATLASSGGTTEVVKVTARSGDSLTVVRAQESTTAQSFAAGSRIEMRVTAQSVLDAINGALNYLGPYAIDPTLRNDGSALQAGDLYFNTTVSELRVYNGSAWQSIVLGGTTVQRFSGNGSTTAFVLSTVPATENTISVYIQGVYQQKDTYSVAGSTLNFSEAPVSGTDNIEVVTIQNIAIGTTSAAMVSITDSGGFYSGTDVEAALQQVIQFAPSGTGAVATTVQTKLRETVSVFDFMTAAQIADVQAGTASLDVTAAIQAALNASYGVYFPSGTYLVSSTLTLRTRHNLKGESAQSTTLQANTNITVLSATDKQRIVIEDLEIFGIGKATSTGSGIQLVNTPYCVFNRVYVIGFNRGVYMKAGGAAPSSNFSNTIRESTIIYNNFNIDCESESNNLTLIACTFGGTGTSYGVRFKDSNTLAIFGGDCEGVTSCCVYVDSAVPLVTGFGLVVSGVHFESNTCSAGDIVFGVTNSLSGASITGNLFYGAAGNATPLSLQYADGVDFSGNTVTGTYTSKTPLLGTVNNIHYRGNYPIADVPNLAMNGITFPATQTPSADPNTLDDYEEGTWTPTWSGLTVVGTPTYTGRYIKIGRQVTCHLYVTSTTSTASTAGTTKITGGFPAAMSAIPANIAGVTAVDASTVASYGVGLVNQAGSEVYTPTWGASATVAVSFSYLSAQ